jgi:hypothetical protein
MWLITRPFVYLFKLLKTVVAAPYRTARGWRRHKDHKDLAEVKKAYRAGT